MTTAIVLATLLLIAGGGFWFWFLRKPRPVQPSIPGRWEAADNRDGFVHVLPVDDGQSHVDDATCCCSPETYDMHRLDGSACLLVVHHRQGIEAYR